MSARVPPVRIDSSGQTGLLRVARLRQRRLQWSSSGPWGRLLRRGEPRRAQERAGVRRAGCPPDELAMGRKVCWVTCLARRTSRSWSTPRKVRSRPMPLTTDTQRRRTQGDAVCVWERTAFVGPGSRQRFIVAVAMTGPNWRKHGCAWCKSNVLAAALKERGRFISKGRLLPGRVRMRSVSARRARAFLVLPATHELPVRGGEARREPRPSPGQHRFRPVRLPMAQNGVNARSEDG